MEKKKGKYKIIEKIMKHFMRKSEKNVMKPKRSGSMTKEKHKNIPQKSEQCIKILMKPLEKKTCSTTGYLNSKKKQ